MRRTLAVVLALAAVLATPAAADSGRPDPTLRSQCPWHAQRLPANGVTSAKRSALRWVHRRFGNSADGAYAEKAIRATRDSPRGGYALSVCRSHRIQRRTVDVYMRLPKLLPSQSASGVIAAVARTGGRYRVWTQLH